MKKILFLIMFLCIISVSVAGAEAMPEFCNTSDITHLRQYTEEEVIEYFGIDEFAPDIRSEFKSIDYYYSIEENCLIYDDGIEAIITSDSGYFFGKVNEDGNIILEAFLRTDYGIRYDKHGYVGCNVYKTTNGYCISGVFDNGVGALIIDKVENSCKYISLTDYKYYTSSFDDKYMVCKTKGLYSKDFFIIVDRETGAIYQINMLGVDHITYIDGNGIVTFIVNDEYSFNDVDYERDFYKYNQYYYCDIKEMKIYPIKYEGYENILYADAKSIIVDDEFCFSKIENGEISWQIDKKDIYSDIAFIMQNSKFMLYGTSGSYHTFSVEEEKKIGIIGIHPEVPAYLLGWSGRYTNCDLREGYTTISYYYDNLTGELYNMDQYYDSCCVYNQGNIIWYRSFGVFDSVNKTYQEREIELKNE